jgi:hypothetical protein
MSDVRAVAVFGLTIGLGIALMAKFWRWVFNQAPTDKREEMQREARSGRGMMLVGFLLLMAAVVVIGVLKRAGVLPDGW